MRRPTQDLLNLAIMHSDNTTDGAIGDGWVGHDVLVATAHQTASDTLSRTDA